MIQPPSVDSPPVRPVDSQTSTWWKHDSLKNSAQKYRPSRKKNMFSHCFHPTEVNNMSVLTLSSLKKYLQKQQYLFQQDHIIDLYLTYSPKSTTNKERMTRMSSLTPPQVDQCFLDLRQPARQFTPPVGRCGWKSIQSVPIPSMDKLNIFTYMNG